MREIQAELFAQQTTYIAITTNGTIKKNGECVMGRGCALEAKARWPIVAKLLGTALRTKGNHVHKLCDFLVSFPVKHNWWEQADLALIEQSCKELVALVGPNETCALPRAGCGNGRLKWAQVKPIMARYLDDRFIVCSK